MKKIMFVGRSGCGKTTLTQALHGEELRYRKTQAISYSQLVVDTPGEFTENRRFYSALIVSSTQADLVGFVQDATASISHFPPNFSSMFQKKCIGIISKSEQEGADCKRAEQFLQRAGATNIIAIDASKPDAVSSLLDLLR